VTGTSGKALAGRILAQLQSLQIGEPVLENLLGLAVDVLAELRPISALESLLAAQMTAREIDAVKRLRNADIAFTLTSGRPPLRIKMLIEALEALPRARCPRRCWLTSICITYSTCG